MKFMAITFQREREKEQRKRERVFTREREGFICVLSRQIEEGR